LPLKNGEADCAIVSMVLHHLSDPKRFISEVGRVLTRNGTFIIVDFEKHNDENLRKTYGDRWLGFSRQEILDMVIPNGFVLKKFRRFNVGNQLALNLYKTLMTKTHEV
jgi:ArsR family transcriptional regulator